jgi:hypothetical protein
MQRISATITVLFFLGHFVALGFQSADLDRDGSVNLQDAIIAVQGLHYSADKAYSPNREKGDLNLRLGDAVKVFQTIAGQKAQVKKQETRTAYQGPLFYAIQTASAFEYAQSVYFIQFNDSLTYHSMDVTPEIPPPQFT